MFGTSKNCASSMIASGIADFFIAFDYTKKYFIIYGSCIVKVRLEARIEAMSRWLNVERTEECR